MSKFNILSSCICRDAFGFQEKCEHEVITFLQSSSPVTWFKYNKKPKNLITMDMMNEVRTLYNFQKKCILKDFNKEVLEAYNQKSDYFIIDLISLASTGVAKITQENGDTNFFTYSKWFNRAYCDGLKSYLSGKIERYNAVEFLKNHKGLLEDTIGNLIDWLIDVKGYEEEQIIVVQNQRVDSWTDSQYLYFFDGKNNRKRVNDTLNKAYDYFHKKVPNCHMIKMPFDTYSDKNHKWGLTELHFCKEFYDYLYLCFDLISKGRENEIDRLFEKYSKLMISNKKQFILNTVNIMKPENLIENDFAKTNNNYIIEKNKKLYKNEQGKMYQCGNTEQAFKILAWGRCYSKILIDKQLFYVKTDDCEKGYTGHAVRIGNTFWKLQNKSTLVKIKDKSIIIEHNGSDSKTQMQIIYTICNSEKLKGKVLTFSVWTRVLQRNDAGKGGSISFINASDYNKGIFVEKKDFSNFEWKKISLYYRVPENETFNGITICMRALASEKDGNNAKVEFCQPRVEIGSLCI